jgi:hypothetical protein
MIGPGGLLLVVPHIYRSSYKFIRGVAKEKHLNLDI